MIKGSRHRTESIKKMSEVHRGRVGWHHSEEARKKMSIIAIEKGRLPPNRKGIKLTEEHKTKLRKAHEGKKINENQRRALEVGRNRIITDEERRKRSKGRKGALSSLWKGGVSKQNRTERENIMSTLEYRIWRRKVYERDGYTCQDCGKRGGKLNAHHVKSFSLYPELRLNVNNGKTLCEPCHGN